MKRSRGLPLFRIVVWVLGALVPLIPTGATAQAAAGTPPPPTAGPPVRGSWTSDRIALQVGDLVTILIDELTQASADRNDNASRERDRDLGVAVGTGGSTQGGSLRTNNDASSRNKGAASRRERFVAEMSTRVVEVGDGGMLRIEGVKKVQIDKHEQQVTVRGWIRSQDVNMDNTVDSWRVADAEILYTSNGTLVKAGGIWSKLLDLIIP